METSHDAATREYDERAEAERRKAVEKYGETALRPEGNTELDVLDYAINELVGLQRYGELVEARVQALVPRSDLAVRAMNVGIQVRVAGRRLGVSLIELRAELLALGLVLGRPEHAPRQPEVAADA